MGNPKRTQQDIKQIIITSDKTFKNGAEGWPVEVEYKDGKYGSFGVDKGDTSMLDMTVQAIKYQLGCTT